MPRFAGDYNGTCTSCDEGVELAIGVRTDRPPIAMHFGPGGPQSVELREFELVVMIESEIDVRFEYACPLCGGWSKGRAQCREVPEPGAL